MNDNNLASQIARKYSNAIAKIAKLNIDNATYSKILKQWKEHAKMTAIPATPAGIAELIKNVESQGHYDRELTYLKLNARYLQLTDEFKDNE